MRTKIWLTNAVSAPILWIATMCTATAEEIPRPEHPRPDFRRDEWLNLNGTWEFRFDPDDRGVKDEWCKPDAPGFDREIIVPFCWESELSGIRDTSGQKIGWYRRTVTVPAEWKGKHVWLRFGAVDWQADVWVNGKPVDRRDDWERKLNPRTEQKEPLNRHEGGYTPFEFELTELVDPGESATIVVRVFDPTDPELPTGKQIGWYTPTSGIWQTVWLEARPRHYLKRLTLVPTQEGDDWILKISGLTRWTHPTWAEISSTDESVAKAKVEVSRGERNYRSFGDVSIRIDRPKLWTPEDPHLYDLTIRLIGANKEVDTVHTYFGLRTIARGKYGDLPHESVLLNGKPIYLRGALDQSFNPRGIYTAPSDEFLRHDIELAKSLGLNFLRIHIKTEEPRRLYWADKLGMLIMQDMPNTWAHSARARAAWEATMRETVALHRNHPSVIAWCIFNETWGLGTGGDYGRQFRESKDTQDWVERMWDLTKKLDPTRLVEDNSPDKRDHVKTDLNSWHFYIDDYETARRHIEEVVTNTKPGSPFNYVPRRMQGTEPLINSEYGAVSAGGGDRDVSWGFRYLTTQLRRHEKIQGYIYTELSDIEWEHNGFVNYDRSPKEFGYDAFVPGMTVADLQGPDFIGFDAPPAIEVKLGEPLEIPIFVSHFSDRATPATHRSWFSGTNDLGEKAETLAVTRDVKWEPHRVTPQEPIRLSLPGKRPLIGAVAMELLDESGKRIAANFVNVVARPAEAAAASAPAAASPRVEVLGRRQVALRFRPDDFAAITGKSPSEDSFARRGKLFFGGAGAVEYRLRLPSVVWDAGLERVSLLFELASKAGNERLDWPSRRNPLDYPQTDGRRHPSRVKIKTAGKEVYDTELHDDAADARGVLSHLARYQHGSYGELVRATVAFPGLTGAKSDRDKSVPVVFEVPAGEGAGGLSIFGERTGRFIFDPTLIVHTTRDVVRPVGWNSDEPIARDRLLDRLEWALRTGERGGHEWRYTTADPGTGWQSPEFDDSAWKTGTSGFGTAGTPGVAIHTTWNTPDIWLRTSLECPSLADAIALVRFYHDENIEIFVNGKLLLRRSGYVTSYQQRALSESERSLLRDGKNTIAVHCHQTGGGQGVDVGLGWISNSTH